MIKKIKMKLFRKSDSGRNCLVCSGRCQNDFMHNVYVQCECTKGEFMGSPICQSCLHEGNLDERLEARAARLEASAAKVRQLRGRIVAPSYEAWKAENDEVAAAYAVVRAYEAATLENDECPF